MDQIIMDFKSTGDRKTIFLTFTQIQFCTQLAISLSWHLPVALFWQIIELELNIDDLIGHLSQVL